MNSASYFNKWPWNSFMDAGIKYKTLSSESNEFSISGNNNKKSIIIYVPWNWVLIGQFKEWKVK